MSDDKEEEINELLAEIELEDSPEGTLSPLESVPLKEDDLDEEKKKDDHQDDPSVTQTATTQPSSAQQQPPTQQPPTQQPPTQPPPTQRQPAIPDEVKEAAAMAATVTREAAADVAKEFTKISSQAQSFLSNMWSQFDPLAAQSGQPAGNREEIDVSERFGLVGQEKVLESFRCTLIQTYAPADNTFTPIKAIGFTGSAHILESHLAFEFDNPTNGKAIVIPLSEITKMERDAANGGSLACRLTGGRSFAIGRFVHGTLELDSAENLLRLRLPQ